MCTTFVSKSRRIFCNTLSHRLFRFFFSDFRYSLLFGVESLWRMMFNISRSVRKGDIAKTLNYRLDHEKDRYLHIFINFSDVLEIVRNTYKYTYNESWGTLPRHQDWKNSKSNYQSTNQAGGLRRHPTRLPNLVVLKTPPPRCKGCLKMPCFVWRNPPLGVVSYPWNIMWFTVCILHK